MQLISDENSFESLYQKRLLDAWESVYKKGQLTLWILLALSQRPAPMTEIKRYIEEQTLGTLTADDKSMYRALRRFDQIKLVNFANLPSNKGGPDQKIYCLTDTGRQILASFVKRNVISVYYTKPIEKLLKGIK